MQLYLTKNETVKNVNSRIICFPQKLDTGEEFIDKPDITESFFLFFKNSPLIFVTKCGHAECRPTETKNGHKTCEAKCGLHAVTEVRPNVVTNR